VLRRLIYYVDVAVVMNGRPSLPFAVSDRSNAVFPFFFQVKPLLKTTLSFLVVLKRPTPHPLTNWVRDLASLGSVGSHHRFKPTSFGTPTQSSLSLLSRCVRDSTRMTSHSIH